MSELSAEHEKVFDVVVEAAEMALTSLEPGNDLPAYLWLFWDSKKFTFEKWHDLDADPLYEAVNKTILAKRPDAVCLVTTGWAAPPSSPRPSKDRQRQESVNFVFCDTQLNMRAAMMKYRRPQEGSPVIGRIIRTDEVAGRQAEQLRTAMVVAHTLSSN
jgi:hypothetical protein